MTNKKLNTVLSKFSKKKILVVGDIILDHFIYGDASRISPEAPIPVIAVDHEKYFLGGAANVARNVQALGGQVVLLGAYGDDEDGARLVRLLDSIQLPLAGIRVGSYRYRTTVKTRVVAQRQQIVRYDRERKSPLVAQVQQQKLVQKFKKCVDAGDIDAVIFEDYGLGVLTQDTLDAMARFADSAGAITTADPTARNLLRYSELGLRAITPNRKEAFAFTNVSDTSQHDGFGCYRHNVLDDVSLMTCGNHLLNKWCIDNVLITLGEQGMCLFRRYGLHTPTHIPAFAKEVFDVAGAGDTVIATLTLALAAGADIVEAAQLANHAAGVVIVKPGIVPCTKDELLASAVNGSIMPHSK